MRKIFKTLFVVLFFNFFTHASSNTFAETKKVSDVSIMKNGEMKDVVNIDEAETDIHPLFIPDLRFK